MQPMVTIALRAARLAAEQIARATERLDLIKAEHKDTRVFFRDTSVQAERTISLTIQKAYPHHSVSGDFTGKQDAQGEGPTPCDWQVTAIDNATNFINGIPSFAITLTGRVKGKVEHAIIVNPLTGEEFTASRGEGAQLNDKRVRAGNSRTLEGTVIGTGFLGRKSDQAIYAQQASIFQALIENNSTPFTTGSVALDLAYLAAGRLDAIVHLNTQPSEQDAGVLVAKEAGALVGDTAGGTNYSESGKLAAANPKLFKLVIQTVHPLLAQYA